MGSVNYLIAGCSCLKTKCLKSLQKHELKLSLKGNFSLDVSKKEIDDNNNNNIINRKKY